MKEILAKLVAGNDLSVEEAKKAQKGIKTPNYCCYTVVGIILLAIVCFLVYILLSKYLL